jgi:hypothetical protein
MNHATQAHKGEARPSDKTFPFYLRELHPKAFAKERADHFFSNRTRSAIFQMKSWARSDKRQWDLNFSLFFCFVAR